MVSHMQLPTLCRSICVGWYFEKKKKKKLKYCIGLTSWRAHGEVVQIVCEEKLKFLIFGVLFFCPFLLTFILALFWFSISTRGRVKGTDKEWCVGKA